MAQYRPPCLSEVTTASLKCRRVLEMQLTKVFNEAIPLHSLAVTKLAMLVPSRSAPAIRTARNSSFITATLYIVRKVGDVGSATRSNSGIHRLG